MYESHLFKASAAASGRRSALRAIGWHELTARISAARDLRQQLMKDSSMATASFGDAAAGYFGSGDEYKRDVNPNALGARKACDLIEKINVSELSASEARELDD